MQKLDFAMIDAKDSELVGINHGEPPENVHNARLLGQAEAEYLNGLLALQKQIQEKYEPQFIENKKIDGEPEDWGKGCPDNIYSEEKERLLEDGADNLWYS